MSTKRKGKTTRVYVNMVDTNKDGKVDMISFLNDMGSIGLAVDRDGNGQVDHIYVFQDVTGDGMLDASDEKFLLNKAAQLFAEHHPPSQIYFDVEDQK